jgi:hypothetical protein
MLTVDDYKLIIEALQAHRANSEEFCRCRARDDNKDPDLKVIAQVHQLFDVELKVQGIMSGNK